MDKDFIAFSTAPGEQRKGEKGKENKQQQQQKETGNSNAETFNGVSKGW